MASCATQAFLTKAFKGEWQSDHYEELIDQYLGSRDSPLKNDIVFSHVLRSLEQCGDCKEEVRVRANFKLRQVAKNNPGSIANDFKFITRQGNTLDMHEIQAEYTVLLFHDPECNLCEQILTLLTKEPALSKAGVAVLAIYLLDKDKRVVLKDTTPQELLKNLVN